MVNNIRVNNIRVTDIRVTDLRRRLAPYLVALLAAIASLVGLVPRPATGAPGHTVDYVLVAGAAGLRWDDVNPSDTPTLWRLAQQGSIGALSVGSAHVPTCAGDGWATLGAGSYAQLTFAQMLGDSCPPLSVSIDRPDGIGANIPQYQPPATNDLRRRDIVRRNRNLPWSPQLGALAETVRCTSAIGPGAAVAAAHPYGRVDRYAPTLPDNPQQALSDCPLSIVDLGTVAGDPLASGPDPVRQQRAREIDNNLARVDAARPARSLLLVVGLADTDATSRLHVAIADGAGYAGGWLTSSSTSRSGYLQLIDVAPTVLAARGRRAPPKLFAGAAAIRTSGRPAQLPAAVGRLSDADHEAAAQRRVASGFFAVLTFCQLALLAALVPVLRRARRSAGPVPPATASRYARTVQVLLVAASLAVPAALVTDAVPWWRSGLPGLVFSAVLVAVLAAATAVVTRSRLRRGALGPLGWVAGAAAAVVAVDVVTGARLQLNGVAGYSALTGGRYAGLGTVGLGVFVAGILLAAGCLALQVRRPWRPVVVAVVGGVGVVLVGSPYLGADAGGAVALTAGVCVAAAMSTGGWLTFPRLAWAVLAGLAVTSGFALLDVRRPVEQRGGLGRFLAQVNDGTSTQAIHRTGTDNVVAFVTSPLTLLVVGSAAALFFALLQPWGGLKRLFGLYPSVRGGLVGIAVATLIAGMVEGVALNVTGAAVATVLPLAALAALRVLDHADVRTVPAPPVDQGGVAIPLARPSPGVGVTAT